MRDSLRRLIGVCLLCVLFVGMMTHYGVGAPDHDELEQSLAILRSPSEADVGTHVYFWGLVERDGETLDVRVAGWTVTVVGADVSARAGDYVQVDGTIESVDTVSADRVIVSERSRLVGLYVVSAVALAVTVGVFFRFWTVDANRLAFVPREDREDA